MADGDSRQPNMISGLLNNTMVFCGLLVAGTITLLAAGPIDSSAFWVKGIAFAAIALSLAGGILSIFSAMYAHNMVRRSEWSEDIKAKRPKKTVQSARSISLHSAGTAFWSAIGAALALTILAVSFFFPNPPSQINGLKITSPNGDGAIEIEGPVKSLKVLETVTKCEIEIRTPTLIIQSQNDGACVIDKE